MAGGVLRQVVDHDQRMLAAIAEVFGHGEAGEGGDPLQPGRARRSRHHDDAAIERAAGLDRVDGAPDARALLADRDVDADDVARLLIDDRVDGDRGLADGPVADDELALAAAEREQRIDHHETGLHRLGHEIAVDDRRCRALDRFVRLGGNRPLAVERATQRIDDAPEQGLARRARARHRPCRGPCRPPRSRRRRPAGRSRFGRARAPGRSRTVPCRSAEARRAWRVGRPETSAMPSPTSSTRPICSTSGPSAAVPSLARACGEPGICRCVRAGCHARVRQGYG